MRFNGFTCALLLLGGIGLSGCGGGDGDSARVAQTVDASKNGVTRIELAENDGYAHFKGTLQLNLIGRNSEDSAVNLNNKATWSLSDASLGRISNGLFTPSGQVGELVVTARYAGLSQSQNVIVTDANLVGITINSSPNQVDECKNAQLTATAEFANGLTLDYPLTWQVREGAELARFTNNSSGLLSTLNSGVVSVVARGVNNAGETIESAPLDVTINDSLLSLALTSNKSLRMREGESASVTATGTYRDNSSAVITDNSQLSATPSSSLTLEGNKITAKNGSYAGTEVELSASCGGATDSLELVVLKKEIRSVEIKNSNGGSENLSVTKGSNLELNVTATFADNSTDANYDYNLNWSIVESKSDDFPDDRITLDQTGKLSVSNDLVLGLNQQINLVVRVEVRDEQNRIASNAQGQQLVDEVNVAVRP